MTKLYDYGVTIGRFQPFHIGHMHLIDRALQHCENLILVIGSINEPRNLYNPFTFQERSEMIMNSFGYHDRQRLHIVGVEDSRYNDELWIKSIQEQVRNVIINRKKSGFDRIDIQGAKVSLVGHQKDETSFYLKLFPQWNSISVENYQNISATPIREKYLLEGDISFVPYEVSEFLEKFKRTDEYAQINREAKFIENYKRQFESLPYPPIFVTVDACVVQSGHVLLVRRRAEPGKGLYALPGGFLNQKEQILDGIIRELREETRIKVPEPVLRGSVKELQVFDLPHRSARGRTITHAALIHLNADTKLPKVVGSDDADKAFWLPLEQVRRELFFEDHKDIIDTLVSKL